MNKKAVIILLVFSIVLNIFLVSTYTRMAKQQNLAWGNMTGELVKVGFWLVDQRSEPTLESLSIVKSKMQILPEVLEAAGLLPYGQDIIPFSMVQKIRSFLNYEGHVVELIQQDLKEKGKISEENIKRWRLINQGWSALFASLQEEKNKTNSFSPIFRKQIWIAIYADALRALDQVEPLPLPAKG